ncbi:MAG: hypothetical protein IKF19_03145 [Bacilli bacterium]|nr:hypothetical protein [Bacilli bacterium]
MKNFKKNNIATIICNIILICTLGLHFYVNVYKDIIINNTNYIYIYLLFGSFILIILLFYLNIFFLIILLLDKEKNYYVLVFSLLVLISSAVFYYHISTISTSLFNNRMIKIKLRESFNNNYKIIARREEKEEIIYDVVLKGREKWIFQSQIYLDSCGTFEICNDYSLYTNYDSKYLNYYLEDFNTSTNKKLKLINDFELKELTDKSSFSFNCDNIDECSSNYNYLMNFKEYLQSNNVDISNYRIIFYIDDKPTSSKELLELEEEDIQELLNTLNEKGDKYD